MTNAASAAVLTPNINLKRVLQVKIKSSPSARPILHVRMKSD